jgi:hypothetical protein
VYRCVFLPFEKIRAEFFFENWPNALVACSISHSNLFSSHFSVTQVRPRRFLQSTHPPRFRCATTDVDPHHLEYGLGVCTVGL